jgi:PIN domain nuclease of toxin-antitoxin system
MRQTMNLLLDTHTFLWAIDNSPNLSQAARVAISDGNNMVFVSAATAWEISIKKALGKLSIPQGSYLHELTAHRFTPLDIITEHALAVENLPAHHQDPFDRLLIAQAQIESLTLVTRDPRIKQYAVQIIET